MAQAHKVFVHFAFPLDAQNDRVDEKREENGHWNAFLVSYFQSECKRLR